MTKFKFESQPNQTKTHDELSAINNIKNHLSTTRDISPVLKRQAKKHHLNPDELLKKTIKAIKEENGGFLPENLIKYDKI